MDKHKLLAEFLETWSIDRLRNMSIEEYTNLNKSDSFCYWIEATTSDLGSIWGGSSFKFGIYKRHNTEKEITTSNGLTDGEYAWFDKYGETKDEAFETVRSIIVKIAELATNSDFDKIEEIDLGEATKWKIAFLYSNYKLINTFSNGMIYSILDFLQIDYSYDESRFSLSNKILTQKKDDEDFFDFGSKFWNETLISQGLKKILKKLGHRVFSYFEIMDRVVENFNLEPNNEKYYFSFNSKELIFTIGQRYIWNLSDNTFKYISLDKIEDFVEEFGSGKEVEAYLNYTSQKVDPDIIFDRMKLAIERELKRTVNSGFKKNNKKDFQELVFNKEFRNKVLKSLNISANDSELIINKPMNKITELLRYKKQIILQGPPGTGKTREAKILAKQLIGVSNNSIDYDIIISTLKVGMKIKTVAGNNEYEIVEVLNDRLKSKKENGTIDETLFEKIISAYNNKSWTEKIVDNPNRRASAFAKFIEEDQELNISSTNDQLKLIQFHPSYTYEDFVRGIVSKPNEEGDGIIYEAENKILAEFAKKALDNYLESKKDVRKSESKNVFDAFIESIKDELVQSENHKYSITDAVYLFSADETRFKYKGDNWVAHNKGLNMKFSELKKIIDAGVSERQEIKKLTELEELTRQHATYFLKLVEKYYDFKRLYKVENSNNEKIELKNYVLIIDEINRANLSSVLGELIYALEYRGESVESMYEVDGDNKLILPPNLYIIGTMNTADRSVGHIDYAIRRRFAFVDVLPKDLSNEEGILFDSVLFHQVAELFETNLSTEFEKKDVQLGHSYFIDKSKEGGSMNIRLEYEIKPILLEYVKDGVLIGEEIKQKIEELEASI